MRAISIWQPWASALVIGSKQIETRHWGTNYRGPLVIHASKRKILWELEKYHSDFSFLGAMKPIGWDARNNAMTDIDKLPFGALIGIGNLVECRKTESFTDIELFTPRGISPYQWTEDQMGNFEPHRYGWVFDGMRSFDPIPFRGAQGFFNVPDEMLRERDLIP